MKEPTGREDDGHLETMMQCTAKSTSYNHLLHRGTQTPKFISVLESEHSLVRGDSISDSWFDIQCPSPLVSTTPICVFRELAFNIIHDSKYSVMLPPIEICQQSDKCIKLSNTKSDDSYKTQRLPADIVTSNLRFRLAQSPTVKVVYQKGLLQEKMMQDGRLSRMRRWYTLSTNYKFQPRFRVVLMPEEKPQSVLTDVS